MALLGALILALQVPIVGIYGLVGEREGNRLAAIAEVRESWGGSQLPQGPVLVVPYRSAETPWIDPYESSMGVAYAYLRPHELRIRATMSPIVRTRGIFDVLLYRAAFHFEARSHGPILRSSASRRHRSCGTRFESHFLPGRRYRTA